MFFKIGFYFQSIILLISLAAYTIVLNKQDTRLEMAEARASYYKDLYDEGSTEAEQLRYDLTKCQLAVAYYESVIYFNKGETQ